MAAKHPQPGVQIRTQLAAIQYSARQSENSQVDQMLRNVARQLKQDGYRVGGVVRKGDRQPGAHRCDMTLEDLNSGKTVSIFQQLGSGAKGCRLDASALEYVVGIVDASLANGIDILIINKFGKREADGRGFSATIARAVTSSVPVLITLNQDYAAPWHQFCGEEGEIIEPDQAAVSQWLAQCMPCANVSRQSLHHVSP